MGCKGCGSGRVFVLVKKEHSLFYGAKPGDVIRATAYIIPFVKSNPEYGKIGNDMGSLIKESEAIKKRATVKLEKDTVKNEIKQGKEAE